MYYVVDDYDSLPQYMGVVLANGTRPYSVTAGGDYKFFQIETGKSQSEYTNTVQITDVTMLSCDNGIAPFAITSANYDKASRTLRFQFNASNLSLSNWNVKALGSTVTTAQGNFSPTSSTVDLGMPDLADGTFTLEITGVSCVGTTSRNFTVGDTGGGDDETLHIMDYDLGTFEACAVPPANIEFGSSATNDINTVTDWIQGTRITKDIDLVADSTFFWIRDKNNHAVVSPVFQKT